MTRSGFEDDSAISISDQDETPDKQTKHSTDENDKTLLDIVLEEVKLDTIAIMEIIDSLISEIVTSSDLSQSEDQSTSDENFSKQDQEALEEIDQNDKIPSHFFTEENRSITRSGFENVAYDFDSEISIPISDEDQTKDSTDKNGNTRLDVVQEETVIEVKGGELCSKNVVKGLLDLLDEDDLKYEVDVTQVGPPDPVVEINGNLEMSEVSKSPEEADCDNNIVVKTPPSSPPGAAKSEERFSQQETAQPTVYPGFLPLIKVCRGRRAPGSLRKKFVFSSLPGPVGLAVLADKSIAVACRSVNTVKRISRTGNRLCSIRSDDLDKPTDVLQLSTGEIVVRDSKGLKLFGEDRVLKRTIGEEHCNKYFGLAEDSHGNIVTINTNASTDPGRGTLTERRQTDLFYFTKDDHLVKRILLRDFVREEVRVRSMCRYLGHGQNKIFIVDMGLDSVYCITGEEEEMAALGDPGNGVGEFNVPAGIAVDDHGNSVVVDSRNNRLQLIDSNFNVIGVLKVDKVLKRPSGICFDRENSELYVSNFENNTVVCYQFC